MSDLTDKLRHLLKCRLAEVQGLLDKSVSLLDKPQGLLDSAADQPSEINRGGC